MGCHFCLVLANVLGLEEELSVEVGQFYGVQVYEVDVSEAREDQTLEHFAAQSAGPQHQDLVVRGAEEREEFLAGLEESGVCEVGVAGQKTVYMLHINILIDMRGGYSMLLSFLLLNVFCSSLQFHLETGVQKCFIDEATKDTHVVVYYEAHEQFENKQTVQVKVFAANSTLVHSTLIKKRKGKFSLVPHLGGQLRFCYTYGKKGYVYSTGGVRMSLRHAIGPQEVDTKNLVKQEDLKNI